MLWDGVPPELLSAPVILAGTQSQGLECISSGQLMSVASDRGCVQDQANEVVLHQKNLAADSAVYFPQV